MSGNPWQEVLDYEGGGTVKAEEAVFAALLQRELTTWEAARTVAVKAFQDNYTGNHQHTIAGIIIAALDDKVQEVKRGKTQV